MIKNITCVLLVHVKVLIITDAKSIDNAMFTYAYWIFFTAFDIYYAHIKVGKRHVIETFRTLHFETHLPRFFWFFKVSQSFFFAKVYLLWLYLIKHFKEVLLEKLPLFYICIISGIFSFQDICYNIFIYLCIYLKFIICRFQCPIPHSWSLLRLYFWFEFF